LHIPSSSLPTLPNISTWFDGPTKKLIANSKKNRSKFFLFRSISMEKTNQREEKRKLVNYHLPSLDKFD